MDIGLATDELTDEGINREFVRREGERDPHLRGGGEAQYD